MFANIEFLRAQTLHGLPQVSMRTNVSERKTGRLVEQHAEKAVSARCGAHQRQDM
jgi:hypothetical protein